MKVNVVRGNAGEIAALAGQAGTMSGVESAYADDDFTQIAQAVAQRWQTVLAVTGATDRVDDGRCFVLLHSGDACLRTLTGSGDIASALSGACLAVEPSALVAASSALLCLGIAAERGAARTGGLGSFGVILLDEIHALDRDMVRRSAKVEGIE